MMDPQQEIFTELITRLKEKYDVYDGELPPEGVSYPFLYLSDTTSRDQKLDKFTTFADAEVRIHVWHDNPHQRGTMSAMLAEIKKIVRSIGKTQSFDWIHKDISQNIMSDDTTGKTLIHGILDVRFEMIGF